MNIVSFNVNGLRSILNKDLMDFINNGFETKAKESMSTIDKCYFDYIERRIKPARWRIWQFNGNPSVSAMRKYSFFDRVTFFDSKDFSIWPNIIYT